jgi:hypothetical protein
MAVHTPAANRDCLSHGLTSKRMSGQILATLLINAGQVACGMTKKLQAGPRHTPTASETPTAHLA